MSQISEEKRRLIDELERDIKELMVARFTLQAHESGRFQGATTPQIQGYNQDLRADINFQFEKFEEYISGSLNPTNEYPPSLISDWYDQNTGEGL